VRGAIVRGYRMSRDFSPTRVSAWRARGKTAGEDRLIVISLFLSVFYGVYEVRVFWLTLIDRQASLGAKESMLAM